MLTQTQIEALKKRPQLGWISALRSEAIRELVEQGAVQLSLFDEQNLAEITSDAYPGERLVVCHNPLLAEDRKRRGLLEAVVVSGGEPTLQVGLAEFICEIRMMGYKVKLDTNGTRPWPCSPARSTPHRCSTCPAR